MLYTKDILETTWFKKTKNKSMEKGIPGRWEQYESRGNGTKKR